MQKLKEKTGIVTPAAVAALGEKELRECYFSRQKIVYVQQLAGAILSKELAMEGLSMMDDDTIRSTLTKIKGIGNWTADIYLMMALQRADLFPLGDVALRTSIGETRGLAKEVSKESIALIAAGWKPYRTIASYILWHAYLCRRKKNTG